LEGDSKYDIDQAAAEQKKADALADGTDDA